MPFAANFSVTPSTTDPTSFSLTDTSTGSDTNLTDRQIFLYQSNGSLLLPANSVTNYIDWPIADSTFEVVGLLTQDYSLNILVNWISSSPIGGSTYTKTELYTFTANTQTFINGLIQEIAATPNLENSYNFVGNLSRLYTELDNAINATTFFQQFSAQAALNRALILIQNQNLFFV